MPASVEAGFPSGKPGAGKKLSLPCRGAWATLNDYCRCRERFPSSGWHQQPCAANHWQAFSTNNIDMSSTESSGAPAEATATPAPSAAPSFGSTRGSGLARGKQKRPSAGRCLSRLRSSNYTPTAIEVVTAPREYQNPFAPVEEKPAAVTPELRPGRSRAPAPAASYVQQARLPPSSRSLAAVPSPIAGRARCRHLPEPGLS